MTTDFDNTFLPFALDIIDKNGTNAIFAVVAGAKTYNRATGKTTEVMNDVIRKISPPSKVSMDMIKAGVAHISDMQTIVAASGLSFIPERAQNMTWDDKVWTIQDVRPLVSGDFTAAYKLIFRGN